MFKVKVKAVGGTDVVDSTRLDSQDCDQSGFDGPSGLRKTATDVIQRVSLFAVLVTDRELHVRAAGDNRRRAEFLLFCTASAQKIG
jgi:hypothetical protein